MLLGFFFLGGGLGVLLPEEGAVLGCEVNLRSSKRSAVVKEEAGDADVTVLGMGLVPL